MITAWILAVCAMTDVAPPAFFAGNDELRDCLFEAAHNHPGVRARYEDWMAALQKAPQVTSLDDPAFTYGQFLQSETLRFKAMVSQKFPWFGTRRTRGEKAAALAEAALARLYAERNLVFAQVKEAYFNYAFLGERIRITESQTQILEFMKDVVRSKLSLGLASEDELLRIAIEKAKVQDQCDSLTQMRPALAARLDEALGHEAGAERPWPGEAAFPPPLPATPMVVERIRAANPELHAFDHIIESRQKQAELAKKKGRPDFTFGLEYVSVGKPRTRRPDRPYPATLNAANRAVNTLTGATPFTAANAAIDAYSLSTANEPVIYPEDLDDNIALSLTMNIPIWRKRIRAGVEEARRLEAAATHDRRRKALALDSAARMAIYEVTDAQRRIALYRDTLLPQARQTYESLQSSYAAGMARTDFLDVLKSTQTLLDIELEQVRAARDWQIAAAELELLMGGPWTSDPGSEVP